MPPKRSLMEQRRQTAAQSGALKRATSRTSPLETGFSKEELMLAASQLPISELRDESSLQLSLRPGFDKEASSPPRQAPSRPVSPPVTPPGLMPTPPEQKPPAPPAREGAALRELWNVATGGLDLREPEVVEAAWRDCGAPLKLKNYQLKRPIKIAAGRTNAVVQSCRGEDCAFVVRFSALSGRTSNELRANVRQWQRENAVQREVARVGVAPRLLEDVLCPVSTTQVLGLVIMENMDGTLRSLWDQDPNPEKARWSRQLEVIQDKINVMGDVARVIHFDLHQDNVMYRVNLEQGGLEWFIIDFGWAVAYDHNMVAVEWLPRPIRWQPFYTIPILAREHTDGTLYDVAFLRFACSVGLRMPWAWWPVLDVVDEGAILILLGMYAFPDQWGQFQSGNKAPFHNPAQEYEFVRQMGPDKRENVLLKIGSGTV